MIVKEFKTPLDKGKVTLIENYAGVEIWKGPNEDIPEHLYEKQVLCVMGKGNRLGLTIFDN